MNKETEAQRDKESCLQACRSAGVEPAGWKGGGKPGDTPGVGV
jgi:hypothetical protein